YHTPLALLPTILEELQIGANVEKTDSPAPLLPCSQDEPIGYWQGPCGYLVQRSGIRRSHKWQKAVRSSLDSESEICPALHNPNARRNLTREQETLPGTQTRAHKRAVDAQC